MPKSVRERVLHGQEPARRNRVFTWGDEATSARREARSRLRRPNAWTREHPREIANPTLRRAWPRDLPGAAICVQDVDVQCVLQFTLIHAAGCALHRHTSRVIHRLELSATAEAATISFQLPRGRGSRRVAVRQTAAHPFDQKTVARKTKNRPGRPVHSNRVGFPIQQDRLFKPLRRCFPDRPCSREIVARPQSG